MVKYLLAALTLVSALAQAQSFPPEQTEEGVVAGVTPPISIIQQAESRWNFDDPAQLGLDSNGPNDLAATGAPAATGGALGYGILLDVASDQRAEVDNTDFNFGASSDLSFVMAGWYYPTTCAAAHCGLVGRTRPASNLQSYHVYHQSGALTFNISTDGANAGRTLLTCASSLPDNTRTYFEARYDAATDTMFCRANDASEVSASSGHPFSNPAVDFAVGGYDNDGTMTGTIDTVAVFTGTTTVPEEVWNGGNGKPCAEIPTADRLACYDFEEDGGPYVEAGGTAAYDLVGFGTPLRSVGLVERPDSGMGTGPLSSTNFFRGTTGTNLQTTEADGVTVAAWVFIDASPVGDARILATNLVNSYELYQQNAQSNIDFRVYDSVSGNSNAIAPTTAGWHLAIGWYDPATKKAVISIDDATPIEAGAALANGLATATTRTDMGTGGVGPPAQDEVLVYLRVLTAGERAELWNGGAGKFD